MQNFQDTEDKVFFECQNILDTLAKISTKEELLLRQDLFYEVSERIAFLKILDKNRDKFLTDSKEQAFESISINEDLDVNSYIQEENVLEEEVIFNNELNEIDPEEKHEDVLQEEVAVTYSFENERIDESQKNEEEKSFVTEDILQEVKSVQEVEPLIAEEENVENEAEMPSTMAEENNNVEKREVSYDESKGKIQEIEKENVVPEKFDEELITEGYKDETPQERKFRLANIKGLKPLQSLFDDDPLLHEENNKKESGKEKESGSLLKSNIPTEYMEAEKKKPEFRLDLNDKIAFSKMLFDGSQSDLNETVHTLNQFKTMDEAKEYLSELYYERKWDKADDYAQRLWSLVENKFL